jgi:hypothetical protein
MIGAEALVTDGAACSTCATKISLAVRTWLNRQRPPLTAWAFDQTPMTIGDIIHKLVKTGTNGAPAGHTAYQTILTEALAAGATGTNLSAILLTAGTAHGALAAQIGCRTGSHFDLINAQMAAALAHATVTACLLTSMADLIATDGTAAAMLRAGPFPTGPTEAATGIAVHFVTNRACGDATGGTEQFLTTVALGKTLITNKMAVTVQHNLCHFGLTDVAVGTL